MSRAFLTAYFLLITTFGLLCIVVLAQEKAPHLKSSPTSKSPMNDTAIKENAFSLNLPGKWSADASNDPTRWSYHADNGHEFLTVSLLAFEKTLDHEQQQEAIKRVAEIHRGVETKAAGTTVLTMSEITYGEWDGVLAARYGGFEPPTRRRFHALLLCSPLAVTVYYYEAIDLSDPEASNRARTIMNSIAVPKSLKHLRATP